MADLIQPTKGKGIKIVISNTDIEAINDFNLDESVELKVTGKVTKITKPEQKENEIKANEPADYTIESTEIEVLNQKEDRKEANKRNLDVKEYKELQSKRGSKSSPA